MSFKLNLPPQATLADVRHALQDALVPKYGLREAAALARIILTHLKDCTWTQLLANEDREASDYIKNRSEEILNYLLIDYPIQYILKETSFYGLKLGIVPGVLIPRPETEELVDLIVKENKKPDLRVLDICTGSGAIALALARNLPFSKVKAIDNNNIAVGLARENAGNLRVNVDVECADIFDISFPADSFDIIVSNPPYVDDSEKEAMETNVLKYEPHDAIFVPDDNPLVFYKRIAEIAKKSLAKGGKVYLEINPVHAGQLKNFLSEQGFRDIEIIRDIHEKQRFIKCWL